MERGRGSKGEGSSIGRGDGSSRSHCHITRVEIVARLVA